MWLGFHGQTGRNSWLLRPFCPCPILWPNDSWPLGAYHIGEVDFLKHRLWFQHPPASLEAPICLSFLCSFTFCSFSNCLLPPPPPGPNFPPGAYPVRCVAVVYCLIVKHPQIYWWKTRTEMHLFSWGITGWFLYYLFLIIMFQLMDILVVSSFGATINKDAIHICSISLTHIHILAESKGKCIFNLQ